MTQGQKNIAGGMITCLVVVVVVAFVAVAGVIDALAGMDGTLSVAHWLIP